MNEAASVFSGMTPAQILEAARSLMAGERNFTANCANLAALIFHALPGLNWAGFYFRDGDSLVLGPFQGKPACVRIPAGQGVCGAAASQKKTQMVADVHAFPGHIACDPASRAEIVIPLLRGDHLLGVLDLDSPAAGRFTQADRELLEALTSLLVTVSD